MGRRDAFLHGVSPVHYGNDFYQINTLGPKVPLRGRIAPLLAGQGYRTTTVYPTMSHMLGAVTYHKSLGMKNFIGCEAIKACSANALWNQVSDSFYHAETLEVLQDEDQPHFVFMGTMRQHNPHVDKFPQKHFKAEVLDEYKRRLAVSGVEAKAFVAATSELGRPAIVLMFGDHIPADFVAAFDRSDFEDPYRTFFNLFDAGGVAQGASLMRAYRNYGVEKPDLAYLDALLLDFAEFQGNCISTKLAMMVLCNGEFCDASTRRTLRDSGAGIVRTTGPLPE